MDSPRPVHASAAMLDDLLLDAVTPELDFAAYLANYGPLDFTLLYDFALVLDLIPEPLLE